MRLCCERRSRAPRSRDLLPVPGLLEGRRHRIFIMTEVVVDPTRTRASEGSTAELTEP